MRIFRFKVWRFAWLAHKNREMATTIFDVSGRWEKVFGPICFLVEPEEPSHDNQ